MSSKSNHSHHHSRTAESKGVRFGRKFLAFVLFLLFVGISLSGCINMVFLNPDRIAGIFTSGQYINALREDALLYAHDMCDEASIPYDSVDNELTYEVVYNISNSYAYGNLTDDVLYTNTTYQTNLNVLTENLTDSTKKMLVDYKLYTKKVDDSDIIKFSEKIAKYLQNKVEFAYMGKLQTVTNLAKTISLVSCIVLGFLAAVLAAALISMGEKKYRGLRAISYSFIAGSMFQFIMVLSLEILKKVKTLVIYPTYLCNSVMDFVNKCEMTVCISAAFSFLLAVIAMTFVWRMKRNEK